MIPDTEKQQYLRELRMALQAVVSAGDRFRGLMGYQDTLTEITEEDLQATFGGYTLADFNAALAGLGAGLAGVTDEQAKAIRKFAGVGSPGR